MLLEYNAFYDSMRWRSLEEVIELADEIFWKERIKNFFLEENLNFLSGMDCAALLKANNILDKVYANFAIDYHPSHSKIGLALRKIMHNTLKELAEQIEYKTLSERKFSVVLKVRGLIYKGGNTGEIQPRSIEDVNKKHKRLTNGIEDKTNLCFIDGIIKKSITARTEDKAYCKAMDTADIGDVFKATITGGGRFIEL